MSALNTPQEVLNRYSAALIELAEDKKALSKVEKDIKDLSAMLEKSDDLKMLVETPMIGKDAKQNALVAVAKKAKFQDITANFLSVLAQNGRLVALPAIIKVFFKSLAQRRGEQIVGVQVAQDLTAAQKKSLTAALKKSLGTDVSIEVTVKPEILGGMIVTVGSQMIDTSVAGKLDRLQTSLRQSAEAEYVPGNDNPKTKNSNNQKKAKGK